MIYTERYLVCSSHVRKGIVERRRYAFDPIKIRRKLRGDACVVAECHDPTLCQMATQLPWPVKFGLGMRPRRLCVPVETMNKDDALIY